MDIDQLISQLENPDVNLRRFAVWELGRIGPETEAAIPVIRKALEDPSPDVRWDAVIALGAIFWNLHRYGEVINEISTEIKATVPSLIKAINDPYPNVRKEAVAQLSTIGPHTLPAIITALEHNDIDVCFNAALAISRFRKWAKAKIEISVICEPLLKAMRRHDLNDDVEHALRSALLGASHETFEEVVKELVKQLDSPDSEVQCAAIGLLWKIGRPYAEAAIPALRVKASRAPDAKMRRYVSEVLRSI